MNYFQKLDDQKLFALAIGVVIILVAAGLYFFLPKNSTKLQNLTAPMIVSKGRDGVPACSGCHGQRGEGNADSGVPRLAGLQRQYIEKQLRDFSNQKSQGLPDVLQEPYIPPRLDTIMSNIASQLRNEEIKEVSAYFESLEYTQKTLPIDSPRVAQGEKIIFQGKPEKGVPSCISCHGKQLLGYGEKFPPLNGQPPAYIIKQLNDWRTDLRKNDFLGLMANIAKNLSEEEILSIATYISAQKIEN